MYRKIFTILILISFFGINTAHSQVIRREFGVRTSGLSDFGFIYKTAKADVKTYKRFRAAVVDFRSIIAPEFKDFSIGLEFAVGFEKRWSLSDKFELIYGFEPYMKGFYSDSENLTSSLGGRFFGGNNPYGDHYYGNSFQIYVNNNSSFSTQTAFTIGLGYVIGLQYQVMKDCIVGIETIPSIYVQYVDTKIDYEEPAITDRDIHFINSGFSFNSNYIALSFIYQFAAYKR